LDFPIILLLLYFLYSHNFIFYKFNIINSAIASTGKTILGF
jgi:hypothetical protein